MKIRPLKLALSAAVAGIVHFPSLFRLSIWGVGALLCLQLVLLYGYLGHGQSPFYGAPEFDLPETFGPSPGSLFASGPQVFQLIDWTLLGYLILGQTIITVCFYPGIFLYGAGREVPRLIPPPVYGMRSFYLLIASIPAGILLLLAIAVMLLPFIGFMFGYDVRSPDDLPGPVQIALLIFIIGYIVFLLVPLFIVLQLYTVMAAVDKTLSISRFFDLVRGGYWSFTTLGIAGLLLVLIYSVCLAFAAVYLSEHYNPSVLRYVQFPDGPLVVRGTPADVVYSSIAFWIASVYSLGITMIVGGRLYERLEMARRLRNPETSAPSDQA